MAEDQDDSQKTEEPTHKRLEEAAKRGQLANSREVNNFLMLLVLTFVVLWTGPYLALTTQTFLAPYITRPEQFQMDAAGLGQSLTGTLRESLKLLAIPFVAAIAAAFGASFLQNPFNLSTEPITPKLEKISISKGLSRMFSRRSLVEFLKGILKIGIVCIVSYMVVIPYIGHIKQMPDDDIRAILVFMMSMTKRILIAACIIMFAIALLDYLYQRFEYFRSLRMTKQELKEEYKQQEGDPIIKQRLRAIRMERARKRMMAAVPKADVVITNPTHYAVALKYDSAKMQAPLLIAKGADNVAFRIRETAKKHSVPVVENPPLARALYDNVPIDGEIPYQHYKAVAEIISYVYRLKGKLAARPAQKRR